MMKKLKFPIKVLLFSMVFPAFLSTQILAKEPPETILKSLPAKIGTFVAENPVSYENKELGASIGYNDSEGTALTLYLYDLGVEKIEEGITSPVVNMAREMAMKDLQTVAGQGYYRNIKLLSDGSFKITSANSGVISNISKIPILPLTPL